MAYMAALNSLFLMQGQYVICILHDIMCVMCSSATMCCYNKVECCFDTKCTCDCDRCDRCFKVCRRQVAKSLVEPMLLALFKAPSYAPSKRELEVLKWKNIGKKQWRHAASTETTSCLQTTQSVFWPCRDPKLLFQLFSTKLIFTIWAYM